MRNSSNKSIKTMAVKARVFNKFRKLFFKEKIEAWTPAMRQQVFTDLFGDVRDAHNELNWMKQKRKLRAEIEAKRVARGYKAKKKTSLAEYEDKMRDALLSKAS